MLINSYENTLSNLKTDLAGIKQEAVQTMLYFKQLQIKVEVLKIDFLTYTLEKKRKSAAYQRGLRSVIHDKKIRGISIGVAVGGLILGGATTKDGYSALNNAISNFNGFVEKSGDTKWVVCMGKTIDILPDHESLPQGKIIIPFETFKSVIDNLRHKAIQGDLLGNLDKILSEFRNTEDKTIFLRPIKLRRIT